MERVINYIVNHGSVDNPVKNKEIASALKLKEVDIRHKINDCTRSKILAKFTSKSCS